MPQKDIYKPRQSSLSPSYIAPVYWDAAPMQYFFSCSVPGGNFQLPIRRQNIEAPSGRVDPAPLMQHGECRSKMALGPLYQTHPFFSIAAVEQ